MDIAYVSPRKEFSKHLLFSLPPVLGTEPEPHEMQASAPLNYSPCLSFFGGRGVGVEGMCYVAQSDLEFAIFLLPSLNMRIPHLCSHTWSLSPCSLTLESPPSQKSLGLSHQLINSNLEIPSVLRRMSFSFSGVKGKLGPAPGVPDLRHWLWPLSSSLPVPPGSTWWIPVTPYSTTVFLSLTTQTSLAPSDLDSRQGLKEKRKYL